MNLDELYNKFRSTAEWSHYSAQTQRQYGYLLLNAFQEQFGDRPMGELLLSEIDETVAGSMYSHVSQRGTTVANQFRTAFNAMCKCLGVESPMRSITPLSVGKKTVTEDQLRTLLKVAYSQFKWRNVGLLVQLTYEQGQSITPLSQCTWDDLDLEEGTLTVNGILTHLSDDMQEMLAQQKEDFGFQPYIAPNPHPTREGYPPYGASQLSRTLRKIKQSANLPEDLNVAEIRRMGLVAMLRDGFDEEDVKSYMPESAVADRNFRKQFDKILRDV